MAKNLVIVESPAKAKTIEKILGKDFSVTSSFGHIRDLDKGDKGVDVKNDFEPHYVVTDDKKKVVRELKKKIKNGVEVWLATDEDREGEAISWHLCKVLGLDTDDTKRIVFREITKPAIKKAIKSPRTVDINLVNAQQARRILDRLVGFELSGLLWRKIKGKLSAGRVQSVAVKLIVEREREINEFESEPFYKVQAIFLVENEQGKKVELKAELSSRLDDEKEAQGFLEKCKGATFSIDNIEVKPHKRRPAPPFTTSTLQQEASRKLNFSVKRTMVAAQKLYESGLITYMRTDSTNMSSTAIGQIAGVVKKDFGDKYAKSRQYKGKKQLAQEAHEAIRPTNAGTKRITGDRDMKRLYELIWKRTIASQMAAAELEKTTVDIGISSMPDAQFKAYGEVLKFDGFLKVYLESKDDEEEEEAKGILPPLKVDQELELDHISATQRYTRGPARFTEASLVKKLEELGIGRPSTYAPTISKIMEKGRGYVVKESREGTPRKYLELMLIDGDISQKTHTENSGGFKNRLRPTDMGMLVSDFLEDNFEDIMDYSFTADMEKQFDEIAEGKEEWTDLLKEFYPEFHKQVEETLASEGKATGERILGKDPESGRTLLVRMTRFGKPVAQIGKPDELEEGEKPKYANLRPKQSMETIEFEEAIKLFDLPRTVGKLKGEDLVVSTGRYGPYVKMGNKFASIPKDEDPLEISYERAKELMEAKLKADAPIGSYQGEDITKGKGRFGPFVKWKGKYVNIPRKYDFDNLTVEEAIELIKAKEERDAKRYIKEWPEEKIKLEDGRWGPFIRFKRKSVKLPKKKDGSKMKREDAEKLTLEDVKKIIEAEIPGSFKKKKKTRSKK